MNIFRIIALPTHRFENLIKVKVYIYVGLWVCTLYVYSMYAMNNTKF